MADSSPWHRSIFAQALVPLVLGTTAVVMFATWLSWRQVVAHEEGAVMRQLAQRSESRLLAEQPVFDRVSRQVRSCRELLRARLAGPAALVRPLPGPDGDAIRELPPPPGPGVSVFVAASAATDPAQLRAAALARSLIAELGGTLAEEPGNLTIAVAGRWLVGWGAEARELVDAMLPDDPVLLPAELEALGEPGPVRWSRAFTEPASGRRQVVATACHDEPGIGRIAVAQALPVEDVLRRATTGQDPGAATVVLDATGSILATSDAKGGPGVPGLPLGGPPSELVPLPDGDGLIGVSRLAGPGWLMATIHRRSAIARAAREAARSTLVLGAILLAAQSLLLFVVLRTRVGKPLSQLADAACGIAAGRRDVGLPPGRGDEVGVLSQAFAAMAGSVSAREAELRAAAEALREREQMLSALIASAADALLILVEGRIVEANPRACDLFAAQRGQLLGLRPDELSPERQADGTSSTVAAGLLARAESGEVLHFPWTHRRLDGATFDAEVGLARIAQAGTVRLVAVLRDVTRRNELETRLHQGQKLESLGQLAGGIAHDFNNMLAGIMGAAELLLLTSDAARRTELAGAILTASERAAGLTAKLLAFARKGRILSTTVDLHQLLADTRQILASSLDKRIAIEILPCPEPAMVVGDASQLQNALINLVVNARDAMPDGGRIAVSTALVELDADEAARQTIAVQPGRFVRLTVSDTGCGIPAEILPHIFEPFFTTKAVGKGTGLGLAAVWGTVRDHHGSITVNSRTGVGTTFSVLLPYSSDRPRNRTPEPAAGPAGRRGTVLLIDDEELVRVGARMLLQELGWQVIEAEDGVQGVERFRAERERLDLVIVDMEMPRMRGAECIRELRLIDPRVRAILCSGFSRDASPSQLQTEGFLAQIVKPYRLAELRRVLDLAMDGGSLKPQGQESPAGR